MADTPPTALRNTDLAVERYGADAERWLAGMWVGDPLADAVIDAFAEVGPGHGMHQVHTALAEGIDAVDGPTPALVALFAQLDQEPAWLDRDRCDRAAASLARHTRSFGLALGASSLLAGAYNTLAGKPLVFTGRYASEPAVRSIEVGSWLTAVTTPGGLDRDQPGFERTVRVRLIHARIRSHLRQAEEWDLEAWGLPIPQAYMAFTVTEFGAIALRAMHQLGVRYTDDELGDIYHLWRAVGRLVGMEDAHHPATPDDQARVEAIFNLTSPGPDEGDRAFVAALGEFQATELAALLPSWAPLDTGPVVHGLQRAFVGDTIADALGVPPSRWTQLPAVLGPTLAAAYALQDRVVPDGKARRTARGFQRREVELGRMRNRYAVRQQLVDEVSTPS